MKASEKTWWMKLLASFGVACITFAVQFYFNVSGSVIFMLGVLIYMALSDLISNINGVERARGLKIGVGAYLFTWILIWVLLNTIVNV